MRTKNVDLRDHLDQQKTNIVFHTKWIITQGIVIFIFEIFLTLIVNLQMFYNHILFLILRIQRIRRCISGGCHKIFIIMSAQTNSLSLLVISMTRNGVIHAVKIFHYHLKYIQKYLFKITPHIAKNMKLFPCVRQELLYLLKDTFKDVGMLFKAFVSMPVRQETNIINENKSWNVCTKEWTTILMSSL